MAFIAYFGLVVLLVVNLSETEGHGRLVDPPHRGYAWRVGFKNPKDYDDQSNYCGGYGPHFQQNGGKCGECGDNYADHRPRKNENGGELGNGIIVKTYKAGSMIQVRVQLTANHKGHFEFSLCKLNQPKEMETEQCFDSHKLELATGGYQFPITRENNYSIGLKLPANLSCEHCVLRWQYTAGNNPGAKNQETFRTCSDIAIQ